MCGLNGIIRLSSDAPPIDRAELLRTRDAMASRGPDGAGEWIAPDGAAALGHRRLSIIDLSEAGAQPMASADGRHRIVFNGEIYNYRELRDELARQGTELRSHSDTEVILHLYAREGAAMLSRLRGMYALAIWDSAARTLFLARDPYGIKPLYYAIDRGEGGTLRFASQVKALEASGAVSREIDPAAVAGFLLWGSVPEPRTIWSAIRALPAGCCLTAGPDGGRSRLELRPFRGAPDPAPGATAVEALEDSVRAHLVADVPVGLFLSAGLDSALIAALACRHLPEPPATFTLTFDRFQGTPRDEGPLAAEIARRLGTRHVERRVGRADFLALWPQALAAMDQPTIDGFNTFVVARLAREAGLKVALSGLGGDEVFGSYPSFRDVPRWARAAAAGRLVPGLARLWPAAARRLSPGRPKLASLLEHGRGLAGAYFLRRGLFLPGELPALLGAEKAAEGLAACDPVADAASHLVEGEDDWTAVHRMESGRYLRNQLLRDSDWASMASSLELRVPLVDARLRAALAAVRFEPARTDGKAALVRRAAPELPAAVFARRKTGFGIPVMDFVETGSPGGTSEGLDSRRLALRVLREFGVNVQQETTRIEREAPTSRKVLSRNR
jgi:asparagine synthase (glutamine-hydrolysing)